MRLSWQGARAASPVKKGQIYEGAGLRHLDLSHNPLGVDGGRAIADGLGKSESLAAVAMRNCGLGPLGASFVGRFGIEQNGGGLHSLALGRNGLGDDGCAAIAAGLKSNPVGITDLDLTHNRIGPTGATRLAEALEYPECTLQVLRLSGNPIGCHGVSTLAEAAKTARDAGQLAGEGLQSLLLANCGLRAEPVMEAAVGRTSSVIGAAAPVQDAASKADDEQEAAMAAAGLYWSRVVDVANLGGSLHKLELQNNEVDDSMVAALAAAWSHYARHHGSYNARSEAAPESSDASPSGNKRLSPTGLLVSSDYARGDVGRPESSETPFGDTRAVANAGLVLHTLNLSRNSGLGDAGVVALAGAMRLGAVRGLRWLSLASCGWGAAAAAALADAIAADPTADDKWSDDSEDEEAVPGLGVCMCTLETLELSGNAPGARGRHALAQSLAVNSSLQSVDMSRMQWDDESCVPLAASLEKNRSLLTLDLGGNAIGLQGICTLGWALSEKNHTLTSLALWNNSDMKLGEERADVEEVLATINATLDDNVRLASVREMEAEEQEALKKREADAAVQMRIDAMMATPDNTPGSGDLQTHAEEELSESEEEEEEEDEDEHGKAEGEPKSADEVAGPEPEPEPESASGSPPQMSVGKQRLLAQATIADA